MVIRKRIQKKNRRTRRTNNRISPNKRTNRRRNRRTNRRTNRRRTNRKLKGKSGSVKSGSVKFMMGEFHEFKRLFDEGLLSQGVHLEYTDKSLKEYMINLGTKTDDYGQDRPAHLFFIEDKSYRDGQMKKIAKKINDGVIANLSEIGEIGDTNAEDYFD